MQRHHHIDYIQRGFLQYKFFDVLEDYTDVPKLYCLSYIHRLFPQYDIFCDDED